MSMNKQQNKNSKGQTEYQVRLTADEARKLVSCVRLAQDTYPALVDDDILLQAIIKLKGVLM